MSIEEYGNYALVIALTVGINAVFFQWIVAGFLRLVPSYNDNIGLKSTFLSNILFIFLVSIFLFLIAILIRPNIKISNEILILILLNSWAQSWFDTNLGVSNFTHLPIRYGVIGSLKSVISYSLSYICLILNFGIIGVLYGNILGAVLSTMICIKYWRGISINAYEIKITKKIFSYGWPILIASVFTILIDSSDRFIMALLGYTKELGGYAAAYDFSQYTIGSIMVLTYLSGFPMAISKYERGDIQQCKKQMQDNLKLLIMISLPAVVGLSILAENISYIIFGEDFKDETTTIMPIISVAIFIAGLNSYYYGCAFLLAKKNSGYLLSIGVGALINVCLNIVTIPAYGAKGAAY
jgi:O-antigen/teichoic acid export membrane protein